MAQQSSASATGMGLAVSAGGAASGAMLPRACVTGALGIDGRVIGRRERASKTGSSVVVDKFFCFVPLPWSQTLVRFLASLCAQGRVWANSPKTRLCSVGREFKFWQNQTKSPTGRSAVRTCDWRHFERARTAAREARSVWVDQGSPEWNEHEASERPSTRSARPSFAIGHRLPFPSRLRVREGRRSRAGKAGGMKVMQRRILLALVAVLCAAIGVQG